eukprot:2482364-Amphidinium_carterae.1
MAKWRANELINFCGNHTFGQNRKVNATDPQPKPSFPDASTCIPSQYYCTFGTKVLGLSISVAIAGRFDNWYGD